jgi:alpha-ketoglutarate-dependent taurine dioxygenase
MTIIIRQIHPHFVGEVTGVDVREKLTRQDADAIEAGMDKYAVLIFRNQDITDEQQLALRAISVSAKTLVAAPLPRRKITGSPPA